MNAARIIAELKDLQSRVDQLLELATKDDAATPDESDPAFMTQAEYAKRAKVNVATVRKWVRAGMPHKRRGRLVMIEVRAADAWEISEADAKKADREAHGGRG